MASGLSNLVGSARRSIIKIGLNPGLILPRKRLSTTPTITGDRFAFVVGLHRSGTTLLHSLLREHPDTSGFEKTMVPRDEGQFLQTVFKRDSAFGGPGLVANHAEAHLTEASPLATPENRDKLLREWGAYYDLDKRILLEKSPANILSTRFFQSLFPGARFVCIVRHPIAVGFSTHNWTRRSGVNLDQVMPHWATAHQIFLNDLAHLEHCMIIRYEDLVDMPEEIVERIYTFLGLPPQPLQQTVTKHNEKYFTRWENDVSDKTELIEKFNSVAGSEMMERFGYLWEPPFLLDHGNWHAEDDQTLAMAGNSGSRIAM
ncbi:MAG: sulfotransferase [Pseudomonadota bacterium]